MQTNGPWFWCVRRTWDTERPFIRGCTWRLFHVGCGASRDVLGAGSCRRHSPALQPQVLPASGHQHFCAQNPGTNVRQASLIVKVGLHRPTCQSLTLLTTRSRVFVPSIPLSRPSGCSSHRLAALFPSSHCHGGFLSKSLRFFCPSGRTHCTSNLHVWFYTLFTSTQAFS